jgi:3-phosphoshikimate 1-carboxyvinyltransferase
MRFVVRPSPPLQGTVAVPGDKSIAHRWLILAATAQGPSLLTGLPGGDDVRSTVACLVRLGGEQPALEAWLRGDPGPVRVPGAGYQGLRAPGWPLDCGNSGTTMRLLAGVLAGRPFACVLDGDESLRRRPMERVAEPLRRMGAEVHTEEERPPVQVLGGALRGIEYHLPVPSAQVKGAVLLAGVQAEGRTVVIEERPTRDHTERALGALSAPVRVKEGRVEVEAFQHQGFEASVPGDLSSAAFLLAAGTIVEGSEIQVTGVGMNHSRSAVLGWLTEAGAAIDRTSDEGSLEEPVGTLQVRSGDRRPLRIPAERLPAVIDEVPALAAVAAHAPGESRFEGAAELRVKESDRLEGLARGLRGLGGEAEVVGDDLVVGGGGLGGGQADARGDHRLAMALAVAALGAEQESVITGAEWAAVSFPGFAEALRSVGADVELQS